MSEEAPSISSTERSVYVASSNPRPVLEPPTKSTNMDSASASKSSPNTTLLKIVKDDGKDADKAVDTSPQTSSDDKSSSSSDSESSPNIAVQVVRSEEELMNIIERTLLKVIDRRDESKAIRPPSPEEDDSVRPAVKARFFPEITRDAILHIEGTNPFKTMKMFDLAGVEKKAVTLQAIPATYRPYEGCMFVSWLLLSCICTILAYDSTVHDYLDQNIIKFVCPLPYNHVEVYVGLINS